jgi:hypothetical protein
LAIPERPGRALKNILNGINFLLSLLTLFVICSNIKIFTSPNGEPLLAVPFGNPIKLFRDRVARGNSPGILFNPYPA